MALETELKPSGVWTVLYQPDIPSVTIDKYQEMFDFLGKVIITKARFDTMSAKYLVCFQVVSILTEPINVLLSDSGFKVGKGAALSFSEKINDTETRIPQSGQIVLNIQQKGADSHFSIMDPACYLFGIPYRKMPIAVGNRGFIERAMSEIYSNAVGKPMNTRLIIR